MAERCRTIAVAIEPLYTEDDTSWCGPCALPSVLTTWFAVRCGNRMHIQPWRYCDDCGETTRGNT